MELRSHFVHAIEYFSFANYSGRADPAGMKTRVHAVETCEKTGGVMSVVCVGILVADILSSPIDSLPAAGELRLSDGFMMNIGGCAANVAVDLRRLGREVRVVGKVGKDLFGDFVIHELQGFGVDARAVKRSETHPTSVTCILIVKGEDRRFVHSFGANADFSLADINLNALDGARALYVGGYMAMPGLQPADVATLFQEAKRRGLVTALDVVIAADKSVSLAALSPVLPYTDIFMPNDDEARMLTGEKDPVAQAEMLARLKPDCTIVITQGERGSLARRGGQTIRAGIYPVESIDGTGAGDAFSAGFLTGYLEGWPLEKTLCFASAVGASCTRAVGTTRGVFSFAETLEFMTQNPLEVIDLNRGKVSRVWWSGAEPPCSR